MGEAEERLKGTYRQVVENVYIRVMAASSGRRFRDVDPHERVAILESFKEAIDADVEMLSEVGQQYRLLGYQAPPSPEEEPLDPLVLDTDDEHTE